MRRGQFEGRMSRSTWNMPGVVERRRLYYGKVRVMAFSVLIFILLGLAVMVAAVIGVVIVVLVVLARKNRADTPSLDDREQPPGY